MERKKVKKSSKARAHRRLKRQCFDALNAEHAGDNGGKAASSSSQKVYVNPEGLSWAASLPSSRLDLSVAIKQLARERMLTLGNAAIGSIFTWKSLKCIEILLEEYMKEQLALCPSLMSKMVTPSDDAEDGAKCSVSE